jgi:predicted DNA-binding mobile mystery protein A
MVISSIHIHIRVLESLCDIHPQEGWLRTVRNALGMSSTQLAKRLGVTKSRVSKAEQDEPSGSVTLKTMQSMAEAMDCKFVYAVVPNEDVEAIIQQRANGGKPCLIMLVYTYCFLRR